MVQKIVKVTNPLGLHLRAAAELVCIASRYKSEIMVWKEQTHANAKSIINLMTLGATQGTDLKFEVNGEDSEQAIEEIFIFFASGFTHKSQNLSKSLMT